MKEILLLDMILLITSIAEIDAIDGKYSNQRC